MELNNDLNDKDRHVTANNLGKTWLREVIAVPGYEQVVYAEESESGLKAIISVHSTRLGPACGGVRMLPYGSKEEALHDVLRLSKGMSYKSALAGIGFGGGKSVIIGKPSIKSPDLFRAMGKFVDSFDGKYIAAKDMNITSENLIIMREETSHVLGIDGVAGSSGDPSPVTARGIFRGFESTCKHLGLDLKGLKVAMQGVGYVGRDIAFRLSEAGAQLWVCDPNPENLQKVQDKIPGVQIVDPKDIYDVECDVFSPCAIGATLNSETIPRLKCRIVLGCANNQLATPEDGASLHQRKILYLPDVVVNSGGIINVFVELGGYSQEKAFKMADRIGDTVTTLLTRSSEQGVPPYLMAEEMAKELVGVR